MNRLFYGDNLQVLRENVADESVDLIYLDPPFNSNADYNVLFKSPKGQQSHAQIEAFEDTWHWTDQAENEFSELLSQPNTQVSELVRALLQFLGKNDMMAYLVMMANRLVELRRVLKRTGSIYLHCDPTASHYLKIVMDAVFGPEHFLNEIIWKRTSAHSSANRYGPVHDTIVFYAMSDKYCWNEQFGPYDQTYLDEFYTHHDADKRRWRRSDLTGAGIRHGETGLVWRGIDVTAKGRHWAYQPRVLEEMDAAGKIHWPAKPGGMPMLKRYLDEQAGVPLQDVWTDIKPMHNLSDERLGYQTQKPLVLLERLINASSNVGDVVLDPFCGCGTAIHAAQRLNRRWIGIDITHLAITLIEKRLRDKFPYLRQPTDLGVKRVGEPPPQDYLGQFEVHGTPKDVESARDLQARDPYQFQWWACSLVNAQPFQGKKKGADGGIDGLIFFQDEKTGAKKIVVSVKGGDNVSVAMVRDLAHVIEREKASLGLFVTLAQPSKPMMREAIGVGFYDSPIGKKYQKLQILTIENLLNGTQRAE